MSGGVKGGVSYHVTNPMMYVMCLPHPNPRPCEQIDACENITFPKLRLRAVIIQMNPCSTLPSTSFCKKSFGCVLQMALSYWTN